MSSNMSGGVGSENNVKYYVKIPPSSKDDDSEKGGNSITQCLDVCGPVSWLIGAACLGCAIAVITTASMGITGTLSNYQLGLSAIGIGLIITPLLIISAIRSYQEQKQAVGSLIAIGVAIGAAIGIIFLLATQLTLGTLCITNILSAYTVGWIYAGTAAASGGIAILVASCASCVFCCTDMDPSEKPMPTLKKEPTLKEDASSRKVREHLLS